MKIVATAESFVLAQAFVIARGARTHAEVVRVVVQQGAHTGQAECVPYARYGESVASVLAQIEALPPHFDRSSLAQILPAGAARNAVDCALWDLAAKQTGQPVWQLAELALPQPQITAYTLSLDHPEQMYQVAQREAHRPLLKVKLGTPDDLPRLEAVRAGAPNSTLILDANEGWTAATYERLLPHLVALSVSMIEQPLPAADDAVLRELPRPITLCADESCHDRASLPGLAERYDMINIKLDKTGGLTEALALRSAARAEGLRIMVGCMLGSSLAMAPAVLLAQDAEITDLDGPLLLAEDRVPSLRYDALGVHPAEVALWG